MYVFRLPAELPKLPVSYYGIGFAHTFVDFCSGTADGLYVVPYNCSAYYRCVQEETFVHLCQGDFIFSDMRKGCLPYFRVPERATECVSSPRYIHRCRFICL